MGRLTRDAELKYTNSGTCICNLSIVLSDKYKTKDGVEKEDICFVNVTYFGKVGEVVSTYFKKGDGILVEGKLKLDKWEKDGKKYSKLAVTGNSFQFMLNKKGQGQGSYSASSGSNADEGSDNDVDNMPF
jgi:single-strand DNA-binding protein